MAACAAAPRVVRGRSCRELDDLAACLRACDLQRLVRAGAERLARCGAAPPDSAMI
jgi:hypothetical protein